MTALLSHRSFRSHRSTRGGFPIILWSVILSVTPLAAQQPAPANIGASPAPREYQGTTSGALGPVLSSSEIAQGAMLLHFANTEGGLVLKSPGRGAFEIAGADHIWFPAEAHLVNGVVVVSTSLVQQPTAMRYTWSNLAAAKLFNNAGLPAAPFHTDK
jgi:hypothetical protein